jgi:chromosome segregation ATPase
MEAKVTMSIKELDELRSKLEKASQELEELKKTEMQVKLTITQRPYTANSNFGFDPYISQSWGRLDNIPQDKMVTSVEYKNIEHFIEPIRCEVGAKQREYLDKLNRDLKSEREYANNLKRGHEDRIKELSEKHKEKMVVKENYINLLEGNLEVETQAKKVAETELKKLQDEVERLNTLTAIQAIELEGKKGFFGKLFS